MTKLMKELEELPQGFGRPTALPANQVEAVAMAGSQSRLVGKPSHAVRLERRNSFRGIQ